MTNSLLFNFEVDKAAHTIRITREFSAELDLVWDAFTKPEILDQWVAPEPWRAETKEMDFREEGRWLYAMISPEDVYHWSLTRFIKIEPKANFSSQNSFSDENGNTSNSAFTSSFTTTTFYQGAECTTVQIIKKMADLAQLEMFVEMGFKEGMAAALKNLDLLLANVSQKANLS